MEELKMNRKRNSFEGYSKELNSCQEIEIKLSKIDSMIFLLNYLFQYRYIFCSVSAKICRFSNIIILNYTSVLIFILFLDKHKSRDIKFVHLKQNMDLSWIIMINNDEYLIGYICKYYIFGENRINKVWLNIFCSLRKKN